MKTKVLAIVLVLISFLTSCNVSSCKEYNTYGHKFNGYDTLVIECTNMSQKAINDTVCKRALAIQFKYDVSGECEQDTTTIEGITTSYPTIIVKDNDIFHHTIDTIPLKGMISLCYGTEADEEISRAKLAKYGLNF